MSTRPLAFVVLGSHRSGTSALTRVLCELGASVPKELLEASSDNPDGYYESQRVIQLDNELLVMAGSRWFHDAPLPEGFFRRRSVRALRRRALRILREDFRETNVFVLKDPRFSRLVPFWAEVLDEFGAEQHWVLMLRHPVEVESSLERRREVPALAHAAVTAPGQALLLWLRYTLEAERDTRARERTILTYDSFLANWRRAIGPICDRHAERLAGLLDPENLARVDALVSPGRRRSRLDGDDELSDAYRAAVDTYEALSAHAEGRDLEETRLDAILSGLDQAHAVYRPLRRDVTDVRTDDPWGLLQLSCSFQQAGKGPRVGSQPMPARVFFVTGAPESRSLLYRVGNHADALRWHGTQTASLPQAEVGSALEQVEQSDMVILHRSPWTAELAELVSRCKDRGVPVGLDMDDLLFAPDLMTPEVFDYMAGLDASSQQDWREYGENLRATLEQADFAIVSTEALAAQAQAAGASAFVLPNALGARALGRARRVRMLRRLSLRDGRIRIGYASGTPTHRRDFVQVAGALAQVLEANASVIFVALGFLELEDYPDLAPYRERIEERAAVPYDGLCRELSRFDVNLAPLEIGNPFCEAKSELKYFEAGALGIPTVASGTGVYRNAIEDGVNGRLASTAEDWAQALHELVRREGLRRSLGQRAQRHVEGLYGPKATRRWVKLLHQSLRAVHPRSPAG